MRALLRIWLPGLGGLALVALVYLVTHWSGLSITHRLSFVVAILLVAHMFEEERFPGGFGYMFNVVISNRITFLATTTATPRWRKALSHIQGSPPLARAFWPYSLGCLAFVLVLSNGVTAWGQQPIPVENDTEVSVDPTASGENDAEASADETQAEASADETQAEASADETQAEALPDETQAEASPGHQDGEDPAEELHSTTDPDGVAGTPPPSCDPANPNCAPCQVVKKKKGQRTPDVSPSTPCCDPKASKLCVSMKPKVVAVPVPTYNPQLHFSLGVMGMVTYRPIKKDKLSPPWSSMLFGMYTTNKSFAVFSRHEAYWDRDNNRAEITLGGGKFNSEFYGTGDQTSLGFALPLGSAGLMVQPQYMRRVWNRLYLGARYRLFWNKAVLSPPEDDSDAFVPIESNLLHSGLGPVATFDSRDNRFSATEGLYVPVTSIFYAKAFGGDDNFANMDLAINYYHSWLQKRLILASRGYFNIATTATPAHMKPAVGMGPDLRGYAFGRYRDNLFMSAQTELRWYFWWKLGAVVFGGIGTTAPGLGKLGQGTVLPSYGLGLRLLAFEEERLVIRIDYGRGDEDGQFYFSVSEAF